MKTATPERTIAGNIKKFLQIAGMTQKELSKIIGCNPCAFSHKMNGKNSREFKASDLALIAKVLSRKSGLRITAAKLMEGVEI